MSDINWLTVLDYAIRADGYVGPDAAAISNLSGVMDEDIADDRSLA